MWRFLLYLFDLVIFLILARVFAQVFQFLFGRSRIHWRSSPTAPSPRGPTRTIPGETARDPICGMFVSTELSQRLIQGAETLHFCSRECLERYKKSAANT